MAKTLILYPISDIQLEHSLSQTSAAGGYVLINDVVPDDGEGYIYHRFDTDTTINSTSEFACGGETGKIYITAISALVRGQGHKYQDKQNLVSNITLGVSINNNSYTSGTRQSLIATTDENSWGNLTDTFSGVIGLNTIYPSANDANVKLKIEHVSSLSNSDLGKANRVTCNITQANVTITYLDVFDCAAELIPGTGIANVSCSSPETVDGNTCTFTATLENNIEFVGWFSDEEGNNLVSTDRVYTATISENTTLYAKGSVLYNIDVYADENCTVASSASSAVYGTDVTVTATPNSSRYTFVGWYSNPERTNLISEENPYTFDVQNDTVLYAKTKINQVLYVKVNGVWVSFSKAYKKINGEWIEQTDFTGLFDTSKNYAKKDI